MDLETRKPRGTLANCGEKKYMRFKPMSLQMKEQG
jgi:phage anti-repressor protein